MCFVSRVFAGAGLGAILASVLRKESCCHTSGFLVIELLVYFSYLLDLFLLIVLIALFRFSSL